MGYWLMKTEPDECSIDDLENAAPAAVIWEGVRNYQARNFMRQMQVGDEVLIYHSSCKMIGVAGTAKVVKAAYSDPTQFDSQSSYFDAKSKKENPRWDAVDVKFVQKFKQLLSLDAIKAMPALQELALVKKGNRLSVMPVSETEWRAILEAAGI